jgi:hypothetical protein
MRRSLREDELSWWWWIDGAQDLARGRRGDEARIEAGRQLDDVVLLGLARACAALLYTGSRSALRARVIRVCSAHVHSTPGKAADATTRAAGSGGMEWKGTNQRSRVVPTARLFPVWNGPKRRGRKRTGTFPLTRSAGRGERGNGRPRERKEGRTRPDGS